MLEQTINNQPNKLQAMPQQYVEGVGMLGTDLEGGVKGYLAAQQNKRADQADTREERKLAIVEETQGWKRQDREHEQAIQKGMMEAGQQGGYEGVIDYLQGADPVRAIQFHKLKLSLDQSMMQTDVMKAQSQTKIADAMVEGYRVIGQMGAALLKADPQDRNNMYKQMLPMIKQVNPDAPTSLNNNAVSMFMLAASQAMPQSVFYGAQKQQLSAQSKLGKLDVDIRSRMESGETVANSPSLAAMIEQRNSEITKSQTASQRLQDMELNEIKNKAQNNQAQYMVTSKLSKDYQAESKEFATFTNNYDNFQGALNAIGKGGGGAAETAAYRTIAMMYNKGALSDPDVAAFQASDATVQQALKKVQSFADGNGLIALNPAEINRLRALADESYKIKASRQQTIDRRYSGMAQKYGVDIQDLPSYIKATPQGPQQQQQQNPFADLIPKKAQ